MKGKDKDPADPRIAAAKAEKKAMETEQESKSENSGIKLLIATPAYGGQVHCGYMNSIIETIGVLAANKVQFNFFMPESESLITRGRNAACAVFLAGNFTHLLFIDSDIRFSPLAVVALLNSGYPICGIPYPIKHIDWEHAYERLEPGLSAIEAQKRVLKRYCLDLKDVTGEQEAFFPEFDKNGFCKVDHIGTGFMMIKRDVLIAMSRMSRKYVNDVHGYNNYAPNVKDCFYDFFDTLIHPETRRYLSEDYAFCFKAQREGFDIWARPGIEVTHSGKMEFFGDFWRTYKFRDRKTGESVVIRVNPKTETKSEPEPEPAKDSEVEELEKEIDEVLEMETPGVAKELKKKGKGKK